MLRSILRLGLGAALLVAGACDEQPPDSPLIQAARTVHSARSNSSSTPAPT